MRIHSVMTAPRMDIHSSATSLQSFKSTDWCGSKEMRSPVTVAPVGQFTSVAWQTCEVMADHAGQLDDNRAFDEFIELMGSRIERVRDTQVELLSERSRNSFSRQAERQTILADTVSRDLPREKLPSLMFGFPNDK